MDTTGTLHLVTALLAVGSGGVVLWLPKGTRWHRTWGHLYVWAMVGVVVTSFLLFNLTGRATAFHLAAVVAGVTLAAGIVGVLLRVPKKTWIEAHATWMAWSYTGLLAAFSAETLTRFVMPRLQPILARNELVGAFWTLVGVASFAVGWTGWWLIKTRLPGVISATPEAMRREREMLRQAPGA